MPNENHPNFINKREAKGNCHFEITLKIDKLGNENDDFSIKTKFDGDFKWRTFFGDKYIRIEIKDTEKVAYYDLDFNQILDEEKIHQLDRLYKTIYQNK